VLTIPPFLSGRNRTGTNWALMNGGSRDQIGTDLAAGRPTISPGADALALRVSRLISRSESEQLFESMAATARQSPSFVDWLRAPDRFLAEIDPSIAASIEHDLGDLLPQMRDRALANGWEVED